MSSENRALKNIEGSKARLPLRGRGKGITLRPFSIPLFLLVWEVGAYLFSLKYSETASVIIMPSLGYIFLVEFPKLASFYGVGFASRVGHEESFLIAGVVLAQNSLVTLARLFVGTLTGIVLGIAVGLAMGFDRYFRDVVETPINVIRAIPALAWVPLFWLWFGGQIIGQLSFIWMTIFLIMVISTVNAVDNLPPLYSRFAATLGASRWQIYRTVVLPGIVPQLSGVLRVVIAVSWSVTLAGEFMGAETGLGYLLIRSLQFLATGRMLVIVSLFILYSAIANRLFIRLHRYATRWMP